jgi:hypothetical protein
MFVWIVFSLVLLLAGCSEDGAQPDGEGASHSDSNHATIPGLGDGVDSPPHPS